MSIQANIPTTYIAQAQQSMRRIDGLHSPSFVPEQDLFGKKKQRRDSKIRASLNRRHGNQNKGISVRRQTLRKAGHLIIISAVMAGLAATFLALSDQIYTTIVEATYIPY